MKYTVVTIFRKPRYMALALGASLLMILITVFLPNRTLIGSTLTSGKYDSAKRLDLYGGLLGGFWTNFTLVGQLTTVIIAILFGINIGLLTYFLHNRYQMQKTTGLGVVGLLVGMLGIGCASCGSVLLTSLLGIGLTTILVGNLPFHGIELTFVSIGLLVISNMMLLSRIKSPVVCK
jgi:hypothetical protein